MVVTEGVSCLLMLLAWMTIDTMVLFQAIWNGQTRFLEISGSARMQWNG